MATRSSQVGRPPSREVAGARAVAWWSSAAVVMAAVAVLLARQTPLGELLTYGTYLVFGVVVPGTLVHKALRGAQNSWLADLGLGAATGLVLGLVAWAGASLADQRGLLWAWPVLTLLVLLSPAARGRLQQRPTQRWPPGPTVALALAAVVVIWQQTTAYVGETDLPPSDRAVYPDLLWHLGLAAEATRDFPLRTPQVADAGTLHYHWFSNAHVAASALMTSVDVQTIMLRLWVLPLALLFVVLTAALAERISGRPWAAAAAAWVALPTTTLAFWPAIVPDLTHVSGYSPSQLFAYPVVLLTLHALVDAVRDRRRRWGTLAVAAIGALGCSGAKSSALPVILGGVALALLAALVLRRVRMRLLVVTLAGLLMTLAALTLVSGGDSGAGIQLLSSLTVLAPYRQLARERPDFATLVPGGLVDGPVGFLLLLALLAATAIGALRTFAFVVVLAQRPLRGDLGAWLLAGVCASSLVPFFALGHQGYSEYYFVYTTIPVGSALLAWSCAVSLEGRRVSARAAAVTAAASAALTMAIAAVALTQPLPGSPAAMASTVRTFLLQLLIIGLVAGGVVVVSGRRHPHQSRVGSARRHPIRLAAKRPHAHLAPLASVALIAALAGSAVVMTVAGRSAAPKAGAPNETARAQGEAALWVRAHVPLDAVTATNMHCLSGAGLGPECDSRRWWLSGLSGRRVLLESWSYVPAAAHVGYYDPALYALNQLAFAAPTPEVLARMQALGASWLVAERLPGEIVSDRLDALATRRWSNGLVTVWQMRPLRRPA
ncbi:MAG: hypothetical protein ABI692_09630 [Terracoccus sp.]